MITLKELIPNSGDSQIIDFVYKAGQAIVELDIDDDIYRLRLNTTMMALAIPEATDEAHRTCFLKLTPLEEHLSIQNSIYMPPPDFAGIMKDKRMNFNLAYGLKCSEYKFILTLMSSSPLASFVINDLESVTIENEP